MDIVETLKSRFEKNVCRHAGIRWDDVASRLKDPSILAALSYMESSGGEPDVIGLKDDQFILADCSKESPKERRSLCYDESARLARKKMPPLSSALEEADKYGLKLLDEEMYRYLQTLGEFDPATSSWIATPKDIREKGGALFCERRYGNVFLFHNGADSYYSNRGFRCYILL